MKLIIVGSGTGLIRRKRTAPSFLLQTKKDNLLFDCGQGAMTNLVKAGIDPHRINHLFITHSHADHISDLMSLLQSRKISDGWPGGKGYPNKIHLHGYPGFKKDYFDLRRIMVPEKERGLEFIIYEYRNKKNRNKKRRFRNFAVVGKRVKHTELLKSVAFRIEAEDKIFVYSGDCKFDKGLIELAENADLFLADASIPPQEYEKHGSFSTHLSSQEAGMIAEKAKVKKLVLFHLYDFATKKRTLNAAQKYYSGEIIIPKDLTSVEI